jgi:carbamoyl-phosphate synthase small subunit
MRAAISTVSTDSDALLQKVLASPEMANRELASTVSVQNNYDHPAAAVEKYHIVAYDFGVKTNSLREFARFGCRVTVVPENTTAG